MESLNEYLIVWCAASVPQGDNASLRRCEPVYEEIKLACPLEEYDEWELNQVKRMLSQCWLIRKELRVQGKSHSHGSEGSL